MKWNLVAIWGTVALSLSGALVQVTASATPPPYNEHVIQNRGTAAERAVAPQTGVHEDSAADARWDEFDCNSKAGTQHNGEHPGRVVPLPPAHLVGRVVATTASAAA